MTAATEAEMFQRYCELKHKETEQLIDQKLSECRGPIIEDIDKLKAAVTSIEGAFVARADGTRDFPGHYGDHYSRMKAAEAEQEFWNAAKQELVKGGVSWLLGAIKVVAVLALIGLGVKLGWVKGP